MAEMNNLKPMQATADNAVKPAQNGIEPKISVAGDMEEKLSRPITSLKLKGLPTYTKTRILNQLNCAGLSTLGDIVKMNETDLRKSAGQGKSTALIVRELMMMGLRLAPSEGPEPKQVTDEKKLKNLAMRLEHSNMDKGTSHFLSKAGIEYVFELTQMTETEIVITKFIGDPRLKGIKSFLAELGLSPAMQIEKPILDNLRSLPHFGEQPKTKSKIVEFDETMLTKLSFPLKKLRLAPELVDRLEKMNLNYVYQVVQRTERNLARNKKLEKKARDQIKEALFGLNLSLGSKLEDKIQRKIRDRIRNANKSQAPAPGPSEGTTATEKSAKQENPATSSSQTRASDGKFRKNANKEEDQKIAPAPAAEKSDKLAKTAFIEGMPDAYATVSNALVVRTNLSKDELQDLIDMALKLEPYKAILDQSLKELSGLVDLLSKLDTTSFKTVFQIMDVLGKEKGFSLVKK